MSRTTTRSIPTTAPRSSRTTWSNTDEAPDAYAMRINRTEDKVDELRGTVEDLEQTVEQQADEIEALRKERENALDELREDLEEALNGEYRTMLKEDIVAELRGDE